ncbi:MAG: phytoene desaturase family protein [Promethearchaeia archaeon]
MSVKNEYDVIIIGAGIGGLYCGAALAKQRKKVLILEKIHHIGGTSYIFRRDNYIFPMGPLSFSFPNLVNSLLKQIGFPSPLSFKRNNFQLISPSLDIVYSQPWDAFLKNLITKFPEQEKGLIRVFQKLEKIQNVISDIHQWHPDYLIGKKKKEALHDLKYHKKEYRLVEKWDQESSLSFLESHLTNKSLIRLLGSQGTYEPVMSLLHLAFMWNVMSFEGIWFPKIGIHGINEQIAQLFRDYDGEIHLREAAAEILIRENKVIGVKTMKGNIYIGDYVVSNADYKRTFLDLINPQHLEEKFISRVKNTPYTGSEFCVYLGIEPNIVDLSNLRASHLFFRHEIDEDSRSPESFFNKEIEICLWSDKSGDFAPSGKKSLILRLNMPYDHFKEWRIGEKKRKEGYSQYKRQLAERLIQTVEHIVPGLSEGIETVEIATPLTYRDWGQRYKGSVAGWSRDLKKIYEMRSKLLVKSPIDHLYLVGIYSVLEPFLGGFPVSIYTGKLVADIIMFENNL